MDRVIEQPLLMLFDRVATKPCPVVARLLENFSAVRLFPTHVCAGTNRSLAVSVWVAVTRRKSGVR